MANKKPKKRKAQDPVVRNMLNAITEAAQTRNNNIAAADNLFARSKGDNEYIAAEVGDYLRSQNSKIQGGYRDTGSRMAQANAALQAMQAATSTRNRSDASAEMARLGIQQAGMGNFDSDNNFAQLINQQIANNDQSNNSFAAQNAGAVGDLLLGMNQGQRQSNVGQVTNKHYDDVTGIQNDFRDFRLKQLGNISEYRAQRAIADRNRRAASARSRSYSSGYGGGSGGGSGSRSNGEATATLLGLQNDNPINGPKPKRTNQQFLAGGLALQQNPKLKDVHWLWGNPSK